jgi:hypothetical protein
MRDWIGHDPDKSEEIGFCSECLQAKVNHDLYAVCGCGVWLCR